MKGIGKFFIFSGLLIVLTTTCNFNNPQALQFGSIQISPNYKSNSDGNSTKIQSIIIDQIRVTIINEANGINKSQNLIKNGDYFEGRLLVPADNGYTIETNCFYHSVLVFQGKNSDLSVNENETVNILVELESTLIQLEISPETLSIKPGAGRQFSALGRFPNGDLDMTPHVSWRLEPQNAGAISSDGMFTTIGFVGGTETVFAHYGDISDSSFVHVLRPDDPFIRGQIRSENGTGISGVQLTFSNAGGIVETDNEGFYSNQVPLNWRGTVTPAKEGYTFEPESRTYQEIKEDQTDQDYKTLLPQFVDREAISPSLP